MSTSPVRFEAEKVIGTSLVSSAPQTSGASANVEVTSCAP